MGRPAYVIDIINDELSCKFFRDLSYVSTFPMHFAHLHIFCVGSLDEDVIAITLDDIRDKCFRYLSQNILLSIPALSTF